MMKKITLISLLCLVMFTATGCKKFSYNIEIDNKGNVSIAETDAVNLAVIESFTGEDTINTKLEEAAAEMKAEGVEVTIFNDGKYKGLTRKNKKKLTIDTLKKEDLPAGFTLMQSQPVVFDKNFLKNQYTIKWNYSLQAALDKNEEKIDTSDSMSGHKDLTLDSSNPEQQMMQDVFAETVKPIADLKITIPCRAVNHNANKADKIDQGFVYIWDLSDNSAPVPVELVFEKVDYTGSAMVLTLVLLFVGLFMFFLKIKEETF